MLFLGRSPPLRIWATTTLTPRPSPYGPELGEGLGLQALGFSALWSLLPEVVPEHVGGDRLQTLPMKVEVFEKKRSFPYIGSAGLRPQKL